MDLFTPIVSESQLHPNFKCLLQRRFAADREVLNRWAEQFQDRDGKFVREFQETFNSGFWELYLFACCKELGLNVDLKLHSPDFVIKNFHNEFCIEAAIASNAREDVPEWERDCNSDPEPDPEQILLTATIRLSNTLRSKYEKYLASYSKLPHVKNRPFLIAVAPFEQPYFFAQNDHAVRQVLYGYDRKTADGHAYIQEVTKKSGASIPLGLFTDGRMREISGVIFSNTATMSKLHALNSEPGEFMLFSALRFNQNGPDAFLETSNKQHYRESLLDGLFVFHNPFAIWPLPFAIFNHADVAQGSLSRGERLPRYKCKHGHLLQRFCVQVCSKGDIEC